MKLKADDIEKILKRIWYGQFQMCSCPEMLRDMAEAIVEAENAKEN